MPPARRPSWRPTAAQLARAGARGTPRTDPVFVDDVVAMPQAIAAQAKDGDVVITMGAGSIGSTAQHVLELLGAAS